MEIEKVIQSRKRKEQKRKSVQMSKVEGDKCGECSEHYFLPVDELRAST